MADKPWQEMTDEELTSRAYRVSGAYVLVKTQTSEGERVVGRYEGTPVPRDVTADWIRHHLGKELVEMLPPEEAPPPPVTGGVAEQIAAQGAPDATRDQDTPEGAKGQGGPEGTQGEAKAGRHAGVAAKAKPALPPEGATRPSTGPAGTGGKA